MRQPLTAAHWRDSARQPRFFMIDAKSVFPLFIFLFHVRLWTFLVAVGVMLFFSTLSRYGFTIDVFLRWVRTTLGGKRKQAAPWWC